MPFAVAEGARGPMATYFFFELLAPATKIPAVATNLRRARHARKSRDDSSMLPEIASSQPVSLPCGGQGVTLGRYTQARPALCRHGLKSERRHDVRWRCLPALGRAALGDGAEFARQDFSPQDDRGIG